MKIIQILDEMLIHYYTLTFKIPSSIEINMLLKNKFEKELELNIVKTAYEMRQEYKGIDIIWEDNEPFIRIRE